MTLTAPIPFDEAVEKLGDRTVIGSRLKSAGWAKVPVALRERAFFSATIENARWLQSAKDGIGDFLTAAREEITLPDGTITTALTRSSRAEFVERMRDLALDLGLGPLEEEPTIGPDGELIPPKDKTGTIEDIRSERRLQLIFDTQVQAAHDYGYWLQGQDPDILDEFPAQRFIREREVKVKRIPHQLNEGNIRRKDDLQFWLAMNDPAFGGFGVPWGPWGFHSGMGVEDVDRDHAERLGLIQPGEQVRPTNLDFNTKLKASVQELDPDIQAWLKMQFGSQVEFRDNAVWWKGDAAGRRLASPIKRKITDWPPDLEEIEFVRNLGGSTGAQLVRDKSSGAQFVLKRGATPEHLLEEATADTLYRAAGVQVPESRLYDIQGRPTKLARYIQGETLGNYLKTATPAQRDRVLKRLRKDFAVDAWLGNWDVAGLDLDNILVDPKGIPWRIDNGGSLRFRAQGTPKTAQQWAPTVREIDTLRDPKLNPQTALIFADITQPELETQIRALLSKRDDLLRLAGHDLAPQLAARLDDLASRL